MLRLAIYSIALFLLTATTVSPAAPWFDSTPYFKDDASRALADKLTEAHGGMQPMRNARSFEFRFFTKMIGNPTPFYSFEALDLESGNAYVDWPFWNASIAWDRQTIWSENWPMPLPPGFFVRLTSSFLTLPWQIHAHDANVGPVSRDRIPGDDTLYDVLRVTFDHRGPVMPGTYYEIFVDADSGLMKALRFNINHPGMVASPSQPLGPNYHVFGDYRTFDGMQIPTYYQSYGQGSAKGGESNAYHFVWDVKTDQQFNTKRLKRPENARIDHASLSWWRKGDPK